MVQYCGIIIICNGENMRVSAADPLTNKCQYIALEQTAEWTGGCDVLSIDGIFVEQSAH